MPGSIVRQPRARSWLLAAALVGVLVAACAGTPAGPVTLRLQTSLTPPELASFQPAIEAIDAAHPEWIIKLENVPQEAESEKVTSELAAGDPPDVMRLQGSNVQQWIRRNAFLDLTGRIEAAKLDLADFYTGPVDQFRWKTGLWALPDTASPEIVFYDKKAFASAGVAPPDDTWTYEDMRTAALKLTVDAAGKHPGDAGFDPKTIARWGWNGGVTYYWQDAAIQGLGGELCATDDCTTMNFTSPANQKAFD